MGDDIAEDDSAQEEAESESAQEEAESEFEPASSRGGGKEELACASVDAGWKGFCTAFVSILEKSLPEGDTPILADTTIEKKLQEKKNDLKEKKMISLQRKELKDQGHALPDIMKKNFEMELRKI